MLIINATSLAKAETDPERFVCLETLTGHSHDVHSVAFSPNNEWLASGSFTSDFDGTIKIWDTSDWSEIKTLTDHLDPVNSVAFSPNNEWLASGSSDSTIKIWDTSDWSCIETLSEHSKSVISVSFSSNNKWLASGSSEGTIKIWDTSDWSEIITLTGHSSSVMSVAFSENNKWLASGSCNGPIKIWGKDSEGDGYADENGDRDDYDLLFYGGIISVVVCIIVIAGFLAIRHKKRPKTPSQQIQQP